MGTQIRPGTVADSHALAVIQIAGWEAAYRHIVPPELFAARTVEVREAEFRSLFAAADDDVRVWVSERGGEALGFALTRRGLDRDIENPGELKLFYVQPALRSSGIGLPLFEHAVGDLSERGLQPYLYTFRDNAAARGWYERRGWHADGATAPWSDRGEYPELVEVRYRPAP
jgi:GNAT superfamily N-acetyltransferase